jgi:hypothetical protein
MLTLQSSCANNYTYSIYLLSNQMLTLQSSCANNYTYSIYLLSNQMLTPVTSFTAINESTYSTCSKIQEFQVSRTECIIAELYSEVRQTGWLRSVVVLLDSSGKYHHSSLKYVILALHV